MSRVTTAIPALAIGVAAAALSTSCSSGQITQTSNQVAAVPGASQSIEMTNGDQVIGRIALRDLMIQHQLKGYATSANAPMIVRIFNDSAQPVRLCDVASESGVISKTSGSVRTPAPSVEVSATATGSPATAAPTSAASAAPTDSPAPSPSASATPRPSAAPAPVPPGDSACPLNIEVPAAGYRLLVPGQGEYLQITQLKDKLEPGENFPVLFQFLDAQNRQWRSEVFSVPMALPGTPLPRASSEIEEAEGH